MKDYGFEPFEAVIALIVTQYIKSKPVSKAEMGKIINPRVIALKDWTPVNTEIDFPALGCFQPFDKIRFSSSNRDTGPMIFIVFFLGRDLLVTGSRTRIDSQIRMYLVPLLLAISRNMPIHLTTM